MNPKISRKYGVWKTVKIGGVKADELCSRIDSKKELDCWARNIMEQEVFTTLDAEEEVFLIALTPKDFGYTERPRTDVLFDPKLFSDWSAENLDGYVLELCPAEVGPHLREQYQNQPNSEILWIAMERVVDSHGRELRFDVRCRGDGSRCLNATWRDSSSTWYLDYRIVFYLRKVS